MTPYEAIRAGTVGAGTFLRQENTFGTVAVGLCADLLLEARAPLCWPEAKNQISREPATLFVFAGREVINNAPER